MKALANYLTSGTRASLLGALFACAVISEMGLFIMPLLVGGIVGAYQVAEGHVGFIITIQLAAFSLASLGLSTVIHRAQRRTLALAGAMLIVSGNLWTAFGSDLYALLPARILTGLGEGTVQAVMAATAAATPNPDRTYALVSLCVVVMSLFIFLGMPPLVVDLGPQGTFLVIACLAGLLTPLLLRLPVSSSLQEKAQSTNRMVWTRNSFAALTAFLLFTISGNIVWYYIERIGHGVGLTLAQSGQVLALASFVSLAGPILAHTLATRFGRTIPLLVAYGTVGCGSLWLTLTASPGMFAAMISIGSAALMFGVPYHMGLFAAQDPAGRLPAAGRGFLAVGSTLAPALAGGVLLSGGGYAGVGWVALVSAVLGVALIIPLARRNDALLARK